MRRHKEEAQRGNLCVEVWAQRGEKREHIMRTCKIMMSFVPRSMGTMRTHKDENNKEEKIVENEYAS